MTHMTNIEEIADDIHGPVVLMTNLYDDDEISAFATQLREAVLTQGFTGKVHDFTRCRREHLYGIVGDMRAARGSIWSEAEHLAWCRHVRKPHT